MDENFTRGYCQLRQDTPRTERCPGSLTGDTLGKVRRTGAIQIEYIVIQNIWKMISETPRWQIGKECMGVLPPKVLSTHQDTWQILEIEMYDDNKKKCNVKMQCKIVACSWFKCLLFWVLMLFIFLYDPKTRDTFLIYCHAFSEITF